jgi:hypothetical protein
LNTFEALKLISPSSVRNHGGIPDIQEDVFELEIGGLVNKTVKLSLKDLKDPAKFPLVGFFISNLCADCSFKQSNRSYRHSTVQWNSRLNNIAPSSLGFDTSILETH